MYEPPLVICHNFLELDAIGVGHYTCHGPTYFPHHSNSKLMIGMPLKSSSLRVKWRTAKGKQKHQFVKEGSVFIVPPNLIYEAWLESQMEMMIIKITPNLIEQIARESQGYSVEIGVKWSASDPLIRQLALSLLTEFQYGLPGNLDVESVGNILATHLFRRYGIENKAFKCKQINKLSQKKLRQAIEYLNDNLSQDITLADLATLVEMNQYQFARAFKDSIGVSPYRYLLTCRIDKAKKLLAQNQLSIAQISYYIGFSSQSHFTSTFRRFTGTTPGFYKTHLGSGYVAKKEQSH